MEFAKFAQRVPPLAADLVACLRFYSRLPVPVFTFEPAPHAMLDFSRAIRMLPLAGALIALPAMVVMLLAARVGLPGALVAGLTLAALIATTGVFHEDGLADTADGFGGGGTIARKLEIMKDSRIGSYGSAALTLALILRWSALVALLQTSTATAGYALIGVAALSRVAGLVPLVALPPARTDGAAYAAQRPGTNAFALSVLGACVFGLLPVLAGAALWRCAVGLLLAASAALIVTQISKQQIGGQTGDVAGAAQQASEIAYFCGLLVGFGLA